MALPRMADCSALCVLALVATVLIATPVCAQLQLESLGRPPLVALRRQPFALDARFSWKEGQIYDNTSIIHYRVLRGGDKGRPLLHGTLTPFDVEFDALRTHYGFSVQDSKVCG